MKQSALRTVRVGVGPLAVLHEVGVSQYVLWYLLTDSCYFCVPLIAGKKDSDWSGGSGGGGGGGASNWGDPRDPHTDPRGMDPRDLRDPRNVGAIDPRDMRGDPRDSRSGMMDPRDHMRGVLDPMRTDVGMRDPRDIRGMGDMRGGDPMLRGDPRGISGRLNGGSDAGLWGQPPQPPHHHGPHHQQSQPPGKMVGPGGVSGSGKSQQMMIDLLW